MILEFPAITAICTVSVLLPLPPFCDISAIVFIAKITPIVLISELMGVIIVAAVRPLIPPRAGEGLLRLSPHPLSGSAPDPLGGTTGQ
jgi:hypothetical protein